MLYLAYKQYFIWLISNIIMTYKQCYIWLMSNISFLALTIILPQLSYQINITKI